MASSVTNYDTAFGSPASLLVLGLLIAAVIFATIPLQIPELTLSLVGAVVYSALQVAQGKKKNKATKASKQKLHADVPSPTQTREWTRPNVARGVQAAPRRPHATKVEAPAKKDFRQPSVAPIAAPTFKAEGFEAEVQELLLEIAPTTEGVQVVHALVQRARHAIQSILPEAEVTGFGCSRVKRGGAFGVAVPDVDIVVSASPAALVVGLQRLLRSPHVAKLDARKLQKSAIRACTDQLVSEGGFKFRRSAFKGQDPKVTLLGPLLPGVCNEAIPVDFSVNCATPLHNAALLTECSQLEPRAKDLVLFVQRWARDRGISHAAKGHLPPYAWSLMAIYFLQVVASDEEKEGALLPALEGFERCAALAGVPTKTWSKKSVATEKKSVACLFKEFVSFYENNFDWRREAVSVRKGRREAPGMKLPIHVALNDDGSTTVALSIEDPFDVSRNVGSFLTGAGCARLREELVRATQFFEQDASLGQLLEPWAPPDWNAEAAVEE